MIFNEHSHARLAELFRAPGSYAGYKPDVIEAPNGDGNLDAGKRYLHVALKYDPPEWARWYLARAHFEACRVAEALGVPDAYYPHVENGTLRVLEYPAGAGSAEHCDFALFTILCWRSTPDDLEITDDGGRCGALARRFGAASSIDPHLHVGELGQLVGLGPATPHRVPAQPYAQKSIVYFAMPANGARLPCSSCPPGRPPCGFGLTVAEWLTDRYARSRVYK